MPAPLPGVPLVRAKMRSWGAVWTPVFQVFSPLITHSSPSRTARVSMNVASLPCSGSVMPNAKCRRPVARSSTHSCCCRAAVVQHQQQRDVVAHDRVLVLQVAVQAEALAGQVLADHRHAEVGPVPAAVFLRERVPVVAGRVGPPPGLREQRLPVAAGQPAAVPVGAGVLPAVVEEADVVVLLLERLDLALDELVEFVQVLPQVLGQVEVHVASPSAAYPGWARWPGLATVSLSTVMARTAAMTSSKR